MGSQKGSQWRQTSRSVLRQPATKAAARWLVERRQATSRDPSEVPSKQRVAGSNPAGRARALTSQNADFREGSRGLPALTGEGRPRGRYIAWVSTAHDLGLGRAFGGDEFVDDNGGLRGIDPGGGQASIAVTPGSSAKCALASRLRMVRPVSAACAAMIRSCAPRGEPDRRTWASRRPWCAAVAWV